MQQITAMAEALVSVFSTPEETAFQTLSTMGTILSLRLAPDHTHVSIKRDAAGVVRMTAQAGDGGLLMTTVTAVPIGTSTLSVLVMATAESPSLARATVTELLLSVLVQRATPTTVGSSRNRQNTTCHPLAVTRPLTLGLPDDPAMAAH